MSLDTVETVQADEREVAPLEKELGELWDKFEEFRADHESLEIMCSNAIVEYWEDKGEEVDIDDLDRGVEMMMAVIFAMELAERKSEAIRLKIDERQKEIVIVDDTDEETRKNDFLMSVRLLRDGRFELRFDIGMLMSEVTDTTGGSLNGLPGVSEELTNSEFVALCTSACEEYAHMAFDVFKSKRVLQKNRKIREKVEEMLEREDDLEVRQKLYHTIPSEYRGGIWKAWFVRTYLPSFRSSWPRIVREAGEVIRSGVLKT